MGKYFLISVFSTGPHKFATVFQDVTDQKKAKDVLERQKRELENTLSATTDGIWSWNFEPDN